MFTVLLLNNGRSVKLNIMKRKVPVGTTMRPGSGVVVVVEEEEDVVVEEEDVVVVSSRHGDVLHNDF